jgi:polysaccharide biosynthesis/export protein
VSVNIGIGTPYIYNFEFNLAISNAFTCGVSLANLMVLTRRLQRLPKTDFNRRFPVMATVASRMQFANLQMLIAMKYPMAIAIFLGSALLSPTSARSAQLPPIPPQSPPIQPFLSEAESDGYVLGAGDRLRIEFFSVPEFTGEYQVLPNGTINFPQVGAVTVQGKTLKQASDTVSAKFSAFLTRPVVTISLLAARPINVAIAGEVNRPGSYTLPALTPTSDVPSLTRTLQIAEGVTQAADLSKVQVRRRIPGTSQMETLTINLWQLVRSGDIQQDLRLRDGDSIVIPAVREINAEESRQLSSVNFATKVNRPLKIVVAGEVNRPGPYTIAENLNPATQERSGPGSQKPSVTQAIQIAGGITQSADIRSIKIRRLTANGEERVATIDFWKLLKSGDVRQDLPLQDGDTIEVPIASAINEGDLTFFASTSISPDKISVNVVGEVERPGPVAISPNAPLNQALLSAGGFNRRAKKATVTLVRLKPNGSVEKRDINIDFSQGLSAQNNPALRNNDTVIVKKSAFTSVTDALGTIAAPFSTFFGLFRLLGL